MDELNFDTDNLGHFKRILLDYYYKSLAVSYDSENPRTFKSICLKCNLVRNLAFPISCCYIRYCYMFSCVFICKCDVLVTVCYILIIVAIFK